MNAPPAEDALAAAGLTIVSTGCGMTAALIARFFADLGAHVVRIEPDGGDPFFDHYPAYRFWLRDVPAVSAEEGARLLATADLCIAGGEDHPAVRETVDIDALRARYPALIVLDIGGYADRSEAAHPAVDLLVQARTGVVYEQFSARPIAAAFPLPSYGAALQGLIGAWVALVERERSQRAQAVSVSLAAGAAMFWSPFWMKAEKADAGFTGITPRDVRHLILRCTGDEYLQMTMGIPGAVARAYAVLGIDAPVDPADRGMPDHSRGPARFFGDVALMDRHSRAWRRDTLLAALRAAGLPAEAVLRPGEAWSDDQTAINGTIVSDADGWSGIGNPLRMAASEGATALPDRIAHYDPAGPPLAGVRVLDFGIFVAGPYASKLLADYGADVIRIEPPSGRSTMSGERTIIAANHGKRAICIDAKSEHGRALIAELCVDADIVLHNFRPGVADRMGVDGKTLRAINPGLTMLETTAYGPIGPKALAPGFDMVIQAHSGLQARAGGKGNQPLCSRSPLVDFATGAIGAIGLLVGLFERLRTGRALAIETNLLNVGHHMMSELVRAPDGTFRGAASVDATQTGFCPAESLYRARGGWVAIAVRSAEMADALARLIDVPLPPLVRDWGETERIAIAAAFADRPIDALMEALAEANIWAERCRCDAWNTADPDGTILRAMHDEQYGDVIHCIGPLVHFSRSSTVAARRLSTAPGADSRAVLAEHGLSEAESEALFAAGVVR